MWTMLAHAHTYHAYNGRALPLPHTHLLICVYAPGVHCNPDVV